MYSKLDLQEYFLELPVEQISTLFYEAYVVTF